MEYCWFMLLHSSVVSLCTCPWCWRLLRNLTLLVYFQFHTYRKVSRISHVTCKTVFQLFVILILFSFILPHVLIDWSSLSSFISSFSILIFRYSETTWYLAENPKSWELKMVSCMSKSFFIAMHTEATSSHPIRPPSSVKSGEGFYTGPTVTRLWISSHIWGLLRLSEKCASCKWLPSDSGKHF